MASFGFSYVCKHCFDCLLQLTLSAKLGYLPGCKLSLYIRQSAHFLKYLTSVITSCKHGIWSYCDRTCPHECRTFQDSILVKRRKGKLWIKAKSNKHHVTLFQHAHQNVRSANTCYMLANILPRAPPWLSSMGETTFPVYKPTGNTNHLSVQQRWEHCCCPAPDCTLRRAPVSRGNMLPFVQSGRLCSGLVSPRRAKHQTLRPLHQAFRSPTARLEWITLQKWHSLNPGCAWLIMALSL